MTDKFDPVSDERLRELSQGATIYGHERNAIAAELLAARLLAARAELERAKRALLAGGYTDLGGQTWKPPLGPIAAPLLDELDAARADLREAISLLWMARGKFQSYEECDQGYCANGFDHEPRARIDELLEKHKETP